MATDFYIRKGPTHKDYEDRRGQHTTQPIYPNSGSQTFGIFPNTQQYLRDTTHLWVIDSGSIHHTTNDKSILHDIHPTNISITAANGTSNTVEYEGSVFIPGIGEISQVLYTPTFGHNILSTTKLCKIGFQLSLDDQHGFIKSKHDNNIIANISVINDLPFLIPDSFMSSSPTTQLSQSSSRPDPDNHPDRTPDTHHEGTTPHHTNTHYTSELHNDQHTTPHLSPTSPTSQNLRTSKTKIHTRIGEALHDNCAHLLHRRLAHANTVAVDNTQNFSQGISTKDCPIQLDCEICKAAKSKAAPIPHTSTRRSKHIYELVHIDIVGPFPLSLGKRKYFLNLVDDFSRFGHIYTLTEKSQAFQKIKNFYTLIQNQHNIKLKKIQTDCGAEFTSVQFQNWIDSKGIIHYKTSPFTPQQNGICERKNGILQTMMRSVMLDADVPPSYWAEALAYVNYTFNRTWNKVINQTPYFLVYGTQPHLTHLRVFGCYAYVNIPKPLRRKGNEVSKKLRFVGYAPGSKAYRFIKNNNTVIISRSATFIENHNWTKIHSNDSYVLTQETNTPDTQQRIQHVQTTPPKATPQANNTDTQLPIRKSKRITQGIPPKRFDVNNVTQTNQIPITPKNFKHMLQLPESEQLKWWDAMSKEMDCLINLKVFTKTTPPEHKHPIGTRWVYKIKTLPDNTYLYKARLVAQGFAQRFPEDYDETYSPTVKPESVKTALTSAIVSNQEVYQFDVQTAYLHAPLEEEIYVNGAPGFQVEFGKTWRLHKGLYGLKQSGKLWFDCLTKILKSMGYNQIRSDQCVMTKPYEGGKEIILIYVDDLIYIGPNIQSSEQFANKLREHVNLKTLGHIDQYLGVQIFKTDRGFCLSQKDKIEDLLQRCGMEDCNPTDTPMRTDYNKIAYLDGNKHHDKTQYQSIIGSLLYISRWSRPDISLSTNLLSRQVDEPKEQHWVAMKRLLRYLHNTKDMVLLLEPDERVTPELICYSDADWAGDEKSRKSTSGFIYFLNGCPIDWRVCRQKFIANSTAEAEYASASDACTLLTWIYELVSDIWTQPSLPITLHEDNESVIASSVRDDVSFRSRHIDIRYKNVRDLVKKGFVEFVHCDTRDQIADFLTKPVPCETHWNHCKSVGLYL